MRLINTIRAILAGKNTDTDQYRGEGAELTQARQDDAFPLPNLMQKSEYLGKQTGENVSFHI